MIGLTFLRGLDRTKFISFSLVLYYLGRVAHDVNFWRVYPPLSWLWTDSGIIGFYIVIMTLFFALMMARGYNIGFSILRNSINIGIPVCVLIAILITGYHTLVVFVLPGLWYFLFGYIAMPADYQTSRIEDDGYRNLKLIWTIIWVGMLLQLAFLLFLVL